MRAHVDNAIGASSSLRGRNFPRRAHVGAVYSRHGAAAYGASVDEEEHRSSNEDNDQDDEEYLAQDDEKVDDFGESLHNSPTQDGAQANAVMDDLDFDDISAIWPFSILLSHTKLFS
jgi:hypothetical protein